MASGSDRWEAKAVSDALLALINEMPHDIDVERILQGIAALGGRYRIQDRELPLPLWARRPMDILGANAPEAINEAAFQRAATTPLAAYIHIPFCSSRCAFCDCYAFAVKRRRQKTCRDYVDALIAEMDLWAESSILTRRPISTVHLGGGTPSFLPQQQLRRLTHGFADRFAVTPATEWALEATTSSLEPAMCDTLADLGFARLHVGIQSLQDPARAVAGRRQDAASAAERVAATVARDWVVSVDMIVGMPGQTLRGALDDVTRLHELGVQGYSLYELQISQRNRPYAQSAGLLDDPLRRLKAYVMFQAVTQRLESLGCRKTLFNHWALGRDTNLYFTFPLRGEDLLALGATADGVIGDVHYRHDELPAYRRAVSRGTMGLQGALRRTTDETRLRPVELELLSANLSRTTLSRALGTSLAEGLIERWLDAGLIASGKAGRLRLTNCGSWFAGRMMEEAGL